MGVRKRYVVRDGWGEEEICGEGWMGSGRDMSGGMDGGEEEICREGWMGGGRDMW